MREGYIVDDVIEIPDYIKNMTFEELQAEIARLEAEERKRLGLSE